MTCEGLRLWQLLQLCLSKFSLRECHQPCIPHFFCQQNAMHSTQHNQDTWGSSAACTVAPHTVRLAELQSALEAHNTYRARHGAPPLTWDTKVYESAQAWTDGCVWSHSSSGYGENIGWGYQNFKAVVDDWYSEVSKYDYNNPGWGDGSAGHFTQASTE